MKNISLELFVSDNCPKCEKAKKLLLGGGLVKDGAVIALRNITSDAEAATELIMAGFLEVPVLRSGDSLLAGERITEEKIRELLGK